MFERRVFARMKGAVEKLFERFVWTVKNAKVGPSGQDVQRGPKRRFTALYWYVALGTPERKRY